MKKFAVLLLMLSGCASVPYSISMVNVGDELPIRRGPMTGMEIHVTSVHSKPEKVCGPIFQDGEEVLQKGYCIPFEAVRLDRTTREHFNRN